VLVDQFENFAEMLGVGKADAHLHREAAGAGIAEGTQDLINPVGVAQKAAADVFFVNLGGRAAHVQIDPRDRMLLKQIYRPPQVFDVFPNQLGKNGSPARVVID